MSNHLKDVPLLAASDTTDLPDVGIQPKWLPTFTKTICETFDSSVNKLRSDLNSSLNFLDSKINKVVKLVEENTQKIDALSEELSNTKLALKLERNKNNDLNYIIEKNESYSRRPNLIFGGIKSSDVMNCDDFIRSILKNHMNVDTPENIEFVRCHVLHKDQKSTKCSVIARFVNFGQRELIWSRRRALKGTGYFLNEDFPTGVNRKRNLFKPILRRASEIPEYSKQISVQYDQLKFKGELYSVDQLDKLPTPINPRTLCERKNDNMLCFGGPLSIYHDLCNFKKCNIVSDENEFNCLEQAFTYIKADTFGDDMSKVAIMNCDDPSVQKQIGRNIHGFKKNVWDSKKDSVMKKLLRLKFTQNDKLKESLMKTGDLELVECTVSGEYWSNGISIKNDDCFERNKWNGKNTLGVYLIELRNSLK